MNHPAIVEHNRRRTFGERLADKTVKGIGTWAFLIVQASVIVVWIVLVMVGGLHLDNHQLTILNLVLSCQAAVTGPLLLLAGNRQSAKDRDRAEHDYQCNQQALEILTRLDPEEAQDINALMKSAVDLAEGATDAARDLARFAAWWLRHYRKTRLPVTARLTIKGSNTMADSITIDTTNATATLEFDDIHGNATSAPDGAVVAFSSDNPAVLTVAADPTNPLVGLLTVVSAGSANVGVTVNDAAGSPVLEADGVTPIAPAPVAVPVGPGKAATAKLTIGEAAAPVVPAAA